MAAHAIELLADPPCLLAEGPLWHPDQQAIYWTDIDAGRLYRYDLQTNSFEACYEGPKVGGMTLQADGSLLLFREKGNVVVWRDGRIERTIVEHIPGHEANRFNDVFADVEGRVYCGTLGSEPGRLYRLDRDGSLSQLLDGIGCPNGMGHTPDRAGLYFTDSRARCIYRFDYDRASGSLSSQKVFATVPESAGVPDGMTVDAAGRVWSGHWGGKRVTCYQPDGSICHVVEIPQADQVTSVLFGGPGYDDLYITTAGGGDKQANGPWAGCLLRLPGAGPGVAEHRSRIGI